MHGNYTRPPNLDFNRLTSIKQAISPGIPLVLHGASGLPKEMIQEAINRGVCKFNVNTDLRGVAIASVKKAMTQFPQVTQLFPTSFYDNDIF